LRSGPVSGNSVCQRHGGKTGHCRLPWYTAGKAIREHLAEINGIVAKTLDKNKCWDQVRRLFRQEQESNEMLSDVRSFYGFVRTSVKQATSRRFIATIVKELSYEIRAGKLRHPIRDRGLRQKRRRSGAVQDTSPRIKRSWCPNRFQWEKSQLSLAVLTMHCSMTLPLRGLQNTDANRRAERCCVI